MLQINKQLTRPDGTTVDSGSVINPQPQADHITKVIRYNMAHHVNQAAIDDGLEAIRGGVLEFEYSQPRECTQAEWDSLDGPGYYLLIDTWLKVILEAKIGVGFITII